jgi:hypothetical protein
MAIAKVQNAILGYSASAQVTKAWGTTPTSGNLLIAFAKGSTANTNASITGWTAAVGGMWGSAGGYEIFYKVAGAGEGSVVLDWASSNNTTLIIMEWSGVTVLDKTASVGTTGSGVTSRSSGTTATTTANDELCVACVATGDVTTSRSWSNSFSSEYDSNSYSLQAASRIVSSTGTYETTMSWTTTRVAGGCIATFKASAAAYTLTAAAGSFTEAGLDSNLLFGRRLIADTQTYTETGNAANLLFGRSLTADVQAYALTGNDANLLRGWNLTADVSAFTLTGLDAGLLAARILTADTTSYALAGIDAALTYTPTGAYLLTAESAAYVITGNAAGMLANRLIIADTQSFTLTSNAAALLHGWWLAVETGGYALTGNAANFVRTYQLAADRAAFVLMVFDALLTYSALTVYHAPGTRRLYEAHARPNIEADDYGYIQASSVRTINAGN